MVDLCVTTRKPNEKKSEKAVVTKGGAGETSYLFFVK